ncbi:hypothetical protein BHE74_00006970 [Ensete ventricosum]|nr:hypothetical protein BHE74_00006970 [Ensete ventricosum]
MGVKQCELCDRSARMHCESDQASLCWECDAKVHGANFLVARHSRWLLCQSCQSPTPWRAEGARPGHAISTCQRCAVVPWSMTPPPVSSSSSSEEEQEEAGRRESGGGFLKRTRENVDLPLSQEDVACSSFQPSYMTSDDVTYRDRKRPTIVRPNADTSVLRDGRFHSNQGGMYSSNLIIAEQSKKQQG